MNTDANVIARIQLLGRASGRALYQRGDPYSG